VSSLRGSKKIKSWICLYLFEFLSDFNAYTLGKENIDVPREEENIPREEAKAPNPPRNRKRAQSLTNIFETKNEPRSNVFDFQLDEDASQNKKKNSNFLNQCQPFFSW
jgi:hypothetical protein